MKYRFEKEFRTAHPETLGETDVEFDKSNYLDFLENEYCKFILNKVNDDSTSHDKALNLAVVSVSCFISDY